MSGASARAQEGSASVAEACRDAWNEPNALHEDSQDLRMRNCSPRRRASPRWLACCFSVGNGSSQIRVSVTRSTRKRANGSVHSSEVSERAFSAARRRPTRPVPPTKNRPRSWGVPYPRFEITSRNGGNRFNASARSFVNHEASTTSRLSTVMRGRSGTSIAKISTWSFFPSQSRVSS